MVVRHGSETLYKLSLWNNHYHAIAAVKHYQSLSISFDLTKLSIMVGKQALTMVKQRVGVCSRSKSWNAPGQPRGWWGHWWGTGWLLVGPFSAGGVPWHPQKTLSSKRNANGTPRQSIGLVCSLLTALGKSWLLLVEGSEAWVALIEDD